MEDHPINQFITTCRSLYNKDPNIFLTKLKAYCKQHDLRFNYDKSADNIIKRIIVKIIKNSNVHSELYYHCNGLVIDTEKWVPIAVPPLAFNRRQMFTEVRNYMEYYDIIPIIDGTIVNLYYWNNGWNISSGNSYDLSNFYWMGNKTYSELIFDLLSRLAPKAIQTLGIKLKTNKKLEFSNLDKSYCYTIGFRHHNFHLLTTDPEKIWNIQKVNLMTLDVVYNEGLAEVEKQKIFTPNLTLDEILDVNKLSIQNALKSTNPVYNYGYILRSRSLKHTGEFSAVILDSLLLKEIKKAIYEYPSNYIQTYITYENRIDFIALKSYFNKIKRQDVIKLFPHIIERINVYSKFIDIVIKCIISILKHGKESVTLDYDIIIYTLSMILIKYINNFDKLDPNSENIEYILRDYLMNIEYALLFIDAMGNIERNKIKLTK